MKRHALYLYTYILHGRLLPKYSRSGSIIGHQGRTVVVIFLDFFFLFCPPIRPMCKRKTQYQHIDHPGYFFFFKKEKTKHKYVTNIKPILRYYKPKIKTLLKQTHFCSVIQEVSVYHPI